MHMPKHHLTLILTLFFILGLGLVEWHTEARAASPPPRQRQETVTETLYTWWLIPWDDPQRPACQLQVNHPDLPTARDVLRFCGWDLYQDWVNTPACPAAATGGDTTQCTGYYLFYLGSEEVTHTVTRTYPPPTVTFHLEGCTSVWPHFRCPNPVTLTFEGHEFFPEARIQEIVIVIPGSNPIRCQEATCSVRLTLPANALSTTHRLTFYATSSLGDATPRYQATVRLSAVDSSSQDEVLVDILSTQWEEPSGIDACAQNWEIFPPVTDLPEWAYTPSEPEALATDRPYAFLAGRLIAHGFVDASACLDGGLLPNGAANTCGLELAREVVRAWQNQFDPDLLAAAQKVGIPAVLFKRQIAHESQFWPAEYPNRVEVGFGQLAPHGMDTLLLWSPELFRPLCEEMLGAWHCEGGYTQLSPVARQILYDSLWVQANLVCANCPFGVDLERSEQALELFAYLLRAHCRQVGQTIRNITRRSPGQVSGYEDLWRFTLANYNGPDCLYEALLRTYNKRQRLDWAHVRENFPQGCESTRDYVETLIPFP